MADFATLGAVEIWIKARMADHQIIVGHSARDTIPGSTTNLCATVIRPMAYGAPDANYGGDVNIYDDAGTIA